MKPFLVVAKNKDTTFLKRLIEEVGNSKVQFFNPWNGDAPSGCELCLVRSTGVYGDDRDLDFLEHYPGPVINPLESLVRFRCKSTQYLHLEKYHIPILPWLLLRTSDLAQLMEWVKTNPSKSYLVKPDRGQGGWGIKVIPASEVRNWFGGQAEGGDLDFVIQPFIEDAIEYRTFFIANELWNLKRIPKEGEVTANFKQNGSAVVANPESWVLKKIERLVQLSGAQYGSIDYLVKKNQLHILELNIVPGIEQLESVTGENIMAKLVRKLLSSH